MQIYKKFHIFFFLTSKIDCIDQSQKLNAKISKIQALQQQKKTGKLLGVNITITARMHYKNMSVQIY